MASRRSISFRSSTMRYTTRHSVRIGFESVRVSLSRRSGTIRRDYSGLLQAASATIHGVHATSSEVRKRRRCNHSGELPIGAWGEENYFGAVPISSAVEKRYTGRRSDGQGKSGTKWNKEVLV